MRKLKLENINQILFLDIETAPSWEHFNDVPDNVRKEWIAKFKYRDEAPSEPDIKDNENYADPHYIEKYLSYFEKLWGKQAGLYPEFSRIVCISMGFLHGGNFRTKSFSQKNELDLLQSFVRDLNLFKDVNKYMKLCAHYGKGFDYPFIAKRLLINKHYIPFILDSYGLKPWEMESLLDTQEIWKIGGYGGSGTLSSIAMAFGIPTPKDDIDGADVSRCYHNGEILRIVKYCEKDIVTLVNIFKAMRGEEILTDDKIIKT